MKTSGGLTWGNILYDKGELPNFKNGTMRDVYIALLFSHSYWERQRIQQFKLRMLLDASNDDPQEASNSFNSIIKIMYGDDTPNKKIDTEMADEIMKEVGKKAYRINSVPPTHGLRMRRKK